MPGLNRIRGDAVFTWHGVVPKRRAGVDGFAVSTSTFHRQLEAIGTLFEVVTLAELGAGRGGAGHGGRPRAALTFDDALRCQADHAVPALRRRGWPFTLCVPTDGASTGRPLWSMLLRFCLALTCPKRLDLGCLQVNLDGREGRAGLADAVAAFVRGLPGATRDAVLDGVFEQCRDVFPKAVLHPALQPLDWDGLGRVAGPDCEIASHSCGHGSMLRADADSLRREAGVSKQVIEALTGRPCRVFCFPYGEYDAESIAAVREAGYAWMLTSCGTAANAFGGDVLPRIDARLLTC